MTKIAIVTGGTRGIGASISKKLKSSNFKVIANYTSNDDAAESFSKENNIEVIKWDVSNYDECQKSLIKSMRIIKMLIFLSIMQELQETHPFIK